MAGGWPRRVSTFNTTVRRILLTFQRSRLHENLHMDWYFELDWVYPDCPACHFLETDRSRLDLRFRPIAYSLSANHSCTLPAEFTV